jgi:hypothetical protein
MFIESGKWKFSVFCMHRSFGFQWFFCDSSQHCPLLSIVCTAAIWIFTKMKRSIDQQGSDPTEVGSFWRSDRSSLSELPLDSRFSLPEPRPSLTSIRPRQSEMLQTDTTTRRKKSKGCEFGIDVWFAVVIRMVNRQAACACVLERRFYGPRKRTRSKLNVGNGLFTFVLLLFMHLFGGATRRLNYFIADNELESSLNRLVG